MPGQVGFLQDPYVLIGNRLILPSRATGLRSSYSRCHRNRFKPSTSLGIQLIINKCLRIISRRLWFLSVRNFSLTIVYISMIIDFQGSQAYWRQPMNWSRGHRRRSRCIPTWDGMDTPSMDVHDKHEAQCVRYGLEQVYQIGTTDEKPGVRIEKDDAHHLLVLSERSHQRRSDWNSGKGRTAERRER